MTKDTKLSKSQLLQELQRLRAENSKLQQAQKRCLRDQEELRKRYEEAQGLAHLGHWYLDLQRNELDWSPEVFTIFGIDQEHFNASYEGFMDTVHPEDRDMVNHAYTQSVANRMPYDIKHRLLMKDGSTKYVHERGKTSYDDAGEAMWSIGTVQDITTFKKTELSLRNAYDDLQLTLDQRAEDLAKLSQQIEKGVRERVLAEERVKKSEQKYRAFMEDASDAIFVADAETGIILDANKEAAKLTGRPVDQLKGMHQSQLHPEGEAEKYQAIFREHIRKGRGAEYEVVVLHRDGYEVPVEIRANVIELEERKLVQGTFRDITERKRTEESLRNSETKYRLAMDAVQDGLWDWDVTTGTVYYSPGWNRILGEEDVNNDYSTWEERIHPEDKPHILNSLRLHLAGETTAWQEEHRLCNADGVWTWVLGRGRVVDRDSQGNPLRMVGTMTDITERKQAEDKIHTSLSEKEVLLREVHHRVKNNMQVISSLLSLQVHRTRNKKAIEVLQDSQQRVRAMAMAHENLYRSQDFAYLKLSGYVFNLVTNVQRLFPTVANRVTVQTPVEDLPIGMDQAIPLGLIINELVTNALKYAFPQGRSGNLTISIQPKGEDEVELMVADNGVGMPEDLEWQNTDTLGLLLVRDLCHQLEASISLDRSDGTRWQIVFRGEEP